MVLALRPQMTAAPYHLAGFLFLFLHGLPKFKAKSGEILWLSAFNCWRVRNVCIHTYICTNVNGSFILFIER